MANWKKNYSSEHLDAADIPDGRSVTVSIVKIGTVELMGEKGKEQKMLVTFTSSPQFRALCPKSTWVAAKTCGYCLAAMFGNDDAAWIGKRVTLHSEEVEAFGDITEAVRVKGSPDIAAPVTIRVKQGRKKVMIKLTPTPTAAAARPAAANVPQTDPTTGEREPDGEGA